MMPQLLPKSLPRISSIVDARVAYVMVLSLGHPVSATDES
jgi:hypothetical protein